MALHLAGDVVVINTLDGGDRLFSRTLACVDCGISMPELSPRAFSFNSPHGGCPDCQGLGALWDFDPERIVPDSVAVAAEGAIAPWAAGDAAPGDAKPSRRSAATSGSTSTVPFGKLPKRSRDLLLYGPAAVARGRPRNADAAPRRPRRRRPRASGPVRARVSRGSSRTCAGGTSRPPGSTRPTSSATARCGRATGCHGERLRPESRAVRVKGRTITRLREPARLRRAARLRATGADGARGTDCRPHPPRDRRAPALPGRTSASGTSRWAGARRTLSGGEAQRIRLATQIGANLRGVLYVLDEPSIGLHQRDNRRLLTTLQRLRDLGNTVIVVEHDEETIRAADYVIDLGPGRRRARRARDLPGHARRPAAPRPRRR